METNTHYLEAGKQTDRARSRTRKRPRSLTGSFLGLPVLILLSTMGCSSSSTKSASPPPGLPPPTAASASNAYLGIQSPAAKWQVSLNHNTNAFSAADLTNSSLGNIIGSFSIQSPTEFLDLAQTNVSPPFQPFGYGLEIPGRDLLLRPGSNTSALAALVPGSCPNINGPVTFQFVTLPDSSWAAGTDVAYGTIQVRTSGNAWNFSNFTQFMLNSSSRSATLGAGTCGANGSSNAVTIPAKPPTTAASTLAVGPSGFFVADQLLVPSQASSVAFGAVGVIRPASALDATQVVGAIYFGFIYEPACLSGQPCGAPTQMAEFSNSTCPPGSAPPSPTAMCGGPFSEDNLGSIPAGTTVIDLGEEDKTRFGLYTSATIQIPDPNLVCSQTGSCTLPAVAVVGNPEDKFAIFLIAQDLVNNSPMVIYLFQQ